VARSVHAEAALKLRYRPRRWSVPLRREGGRLSVGGAVGASDDRLFNAVAVLARELSWKGTAREYRAELEKRGYDREAGSPVRAEARRRPPVHGLGWMR